MDPSAIERLQAKALEEAIIEQVSRDFHLAPFMARTQFAQMRQYFEQYLGLEHEVGTLEVGKRADLVVLNRDPTLLEPHELGRLEVVRTVCGGADGVSRGPG